MKFLKLAVVVAVLALAMRGMALAQPTTTIPVQAEVTSGCVMTGSTFDFGQVNPLSITTTELEKQNVSLVVTCTSAPSSALTIAIDDGANAALPTTFALPGHRAITNGTSALGYDVYQPTTVLESISNGPSIFGNTTCSTPGAVLWELGTHTYNASGLVTVPNENVFDICGIIPAQLSPLTAGVYTDTLTVTMNF